MRAEPIICAVQARQEPVDKPSGKLAAPNQAQYEPLVDLANADLKKIPWRESQS
jgi:hypothetical protein